MTTGIAAICVLATLVLGLGINVSRLRGRRQSTGGSQFPTDPGDELFKAVRAHANACEYVPVLAVLILIDTTRDPAAWVLAVTVGATAARLLHAYAMLTSPTLQRQTGLRLVGAAATYVSGLVLVAAALTTV